MPNTAVEYLDIGDGVTYAFNLPQGSNLDIESIDFNNVVEQNGTDIYDLLSPITHSHPYCDTIYIDNAVTYTDYEWITFHRAENDWYNGPYLVTVDDKEGVFYGSEGARCYLPCGVNAGLDQSDEDWGWGSVYPYNILAKRGNKLVVDGDSDSTMTLTIMYDDGRVVNYTGWNIITTFYNVRGFYISGNPDNVWLDDIYYAQENASDLDVVGLAQRMPWSYYKFSTGTAASWGITTNYVESWNYNWYWIMEDTQVQIYIS